MSMQIWPILLTLARVLVVSWHVYAFNVISVPYETRHFSESVFWTEGSSISFSGRAHAPTPTSLRKELSSCPSPLDTKGTWQNRLLPDPLHSARNARELFR